MHAAIAALTLLVAAPPAASWPASMDRQTAPAIAPAIAPEGFSFRGSTPRLTIVHEAPYYDCYSRNRRRLECYPGFHEVHYRRPYNYRVLIDYPWHAEPNRHVACENCGGAAVAEDVPQAARNTVPWNTAPRFGKTP